MSRYDMKEFGEAASFLRKSELELLSAHTVAFDGKPNKEGSKKKTHKKKLEHCRTNNIKYIHIRNEFSFDLILKLYLFLSNEKIEPVV